MKKLAVGCGHRVSEINLVRLDLSSQVETDVIWDLNKVPYPFENSSFSEIECFDVIEHLDAIPIVLEEFHRILTPNGILKITTPHFSCANSYIDPTHKWHLSYCSFDYFLDDHTLSYYSKARYQIKYRHIQFQGGRINRSIISRLANKYPINYEQRWAWIFPAWYLYFELESIK
ncbi:MULTISPECIES: class I SAM-dependent methyltransferase [unclassified Nostoc]|uniref:class I SAM-dependent methyltransferase n=1 Tax=unclassified Nostoc TaxID=2593658 RepID=UPI0026098231|nr:methyltransferase domain-containing protein [Nostoc sp. S13]MDF5735824.1 methyltransferase domain-containing protein [Nostoc sp. S13]